MKYSDLLNLDITGKTVVIIGCPASGKTTLAKRLAERTGNRLVETDAYLRHDYKAALYELIEHDLMPFSGAVIVEGVQGYRLLRKGVEGWEGWHFYPDVVIELKVTDEQVERVYKKERMFDKRRAVDNVLKSVAAFAKMHQTILDKYRAMENPHPPKWITVENQF